MTRGRLGAFMVVFALVAAACTGGGTEPSTNAPEPAADGGSATTQVTEPGGTEPVSFAGTDPAPEFPTGLDWLNTDRPLSLAQLEGKVVLLDFWTYGCVNCMHIIPDLERLEEEFADELVVIGVHSAKFTNEAVTDNIRNVILRYGLTHPVVNDRDFEVWRQWGARAWPTLVLIDPAGNIVGGHSGEGIYPVFQPVIDALVTEFDERGEVDRTALEIKLESEGLPESVLSFPGKVLADPSGGRLFVADTNHDRVLVADIVTGEVVDVVGSGDRGFAGGDFSVARFDEPQGLALGDGGTTLYVADTGNHAVRALDLDSRTVITIVGTGLQAPNYPPRPGVAPDVALSSPWDLALDGSLLYIAMAGSHQLWTLDLDTAAVEPFAGTGGEDVVDGPRLSSLLAQPSGLVLDGGGRLYFADSESSTVRWAETTTGGETGLLSGSGDGLFDFGDEDGVGSEARLQHPLGLAFDGTHVFVADTYNSKIKRIDPATGETVTFAGGEQGWADGSEARFDEPGGLDFAAGVLYVADTNNHVIRTIDTSTGDTSTLVLFGIERFANPTDGFVGTVVRLDPIEVAPGEGRVVIDVSIPAGYKVNDLAPYSMMWTVEGDAIALASDADRSVVAPEFPLEVGATFSAGEGQVTGDLTIYYCTADAESLCLIEQVRIEAPVVVTPGADSGLVLEHVIPQPEV